MFFYSTNNKSLKVNFEMALKLGQAPDLGLFMPENFPIIKEYELQKMQNMEYWEIANLILAKFLGDEIEQDELSKMCKESYNFEIPLEKTNLNENSKFNTKTNFEPYILRLDQGPTAAFKDFAARIMAKLLDYFLTKQNKNQEKKQKVNILVATSGDTGSSIGSAFFGLKNIQVIVLFPPDEISEVQRKLMTTLGSNIKCLAIQNGKFDDCQKFVKMAFSDSNLKNLNITSANSINIARLLPQSVYYFWVYSRLQKKSKLPIMPVFSVPSGNFGNLMGGLIASFMGLPIHKLIAATNQNKSFANFYQTQKYKPISPSISCLSNAMNVGNPNNIPRIFELFEGSLDLNQDILKQPNLQKLKQKIYATSFSDVQTINCMQEVLKNYQTQNQPVILEPHGAVAWLGLKEFFDQNPNLPQNIIPICLETAHPAKFPQEIKQILNFEPKVPKSLKEVQDKAEEIHEISNNYEDFKNYLLKNCIF
jgi:threonine synthase